MDKRIVRLEDDVWRIRTDAGELSETERNEMMEFFVEVKMPYKIIAGNLCVSGGVDRNTLFERIEHFYEGRAEVYPF